MDDLDDLLNPRTIERRPTGADRLREQTARVVRRRRWRGHVRRAALLAACYVAGVGTLWLAQRGSPPRESPSVVPDALAPPAPREPTATVRTAQPEPPELLERRAALATGERYVELYRRAGDSYLARGDEIAALRCYRRSLDASRPDQLHIQPDLDTWLLMSLKFARNKETSDARN